MGSPSPKRTDTGGASARTDRIEVDDLAVAGPVIGLIAGDPVVSRPLSGGRLSGCQRIDYGRWSSRCQQPGRCRWRPGGRSGPVVVGGRVVVGGLATDIGGGLVARGEHPIVVGCLVVDDEF